MSKVLFVGVDVDDNAFRACGRTAEGVKQFEFSCRPNAGVLERRLRQWAGAQSEIRVCYEATYLGFTLQRELTRRGLSCEVIAPSLVPVLPGEKVKTNRLDAQKLSEYYCRNQLVVVHVPNEAEEAVRDLVRARRFLTEQLKRQKQYLLSLCRRVGLDYRASSAEQEASAKSPRGNYWTQAHLRWLNTQIGQVASAALKFNLEGQLRQLDQIQTEIESYERQIGKFAEQPRYKRAVQALVCMRGINVITAMTLIVELGPIERFSHPRQIASYAGMDLCEYSSKEIRRWGITAMGNRYLRTAAVESVQGASRPPKVSKPLKARRKDAEPPFIDVADRCMRRLHKKSTRLLFAGKHVNKVKVACARELLCFVWEALKSAA